MRRIQGGQCQAVYSAIGLIELLTGPKKQGNYELAAKYREMIAHFPNLQIEGINESVVDVASTLRATYGITTPDAIHIATAMDFGAKKFITNDKKLSKIKEIQIELLG
jgi:predicted nucleic acid-binding protein